MFFLALADTAGKQNITSTEQLLSMRSIIKKRELGKRSGTAGEAGGHGREGGHQSEESEGGDCGHGVHEVLSGQWQQWQQWLAENGARLLHYARRQTRNEHDAEDVVQDSVVRMWKLRDRCPDGVPALSFAFQTIRCRAIDIGRQLDRRRAREDATFRLMQAGNGEWVEDGLVEKRERSAVLRKALLSLPVKLREVIELKIWGDLTFAEIAGKVGAPLNTVTSRYRYALARLRREVLPLRPDSGA